MEQSAKTSERRRVPRISLDLPATVIWGRKRRTYRARELSEFGVFLAPKRKEAAIEKEWVRQKEAVVIDLVLETKDHPLALAGIVIASTGDGIAVRFKNLSLEHHALLRNYVLARGIGIEKP